MKFAEKRCHTNGAVATISDGNSHAITYYYDDFNRLAQIVYPYSPSDSEVYSYDNSGNKTQTLTRSHHYTITYTYDALNRLITKAPISSRPSPTATTTAVGCSRRK